MSLNYQFTDKERWAKLTDEDKAWNDAYIWMALGLDLGEITEKTAPEWVWRWTFYSKLVGPAYWKVVDGKRDSEYRPDLAEVQKRIGLHTNVSTKTRNQFVKKMVDSFDRDMQYILNPRHD